jgi:transcriptional regulator with XRE-family HTH domain
MITPEPSDQTIDALDPGMVRAGAAAAARRRELDISQRSLAADGIINAGALIAFEKGRAWPRERTRAKLEKVLQWPPGTIAQLRRGEQPHEPRVAAAATAGTEAPLIAQAMLTAVNALDSAIDDLPAVDDPDFAPRVSKILADLRQLEGVATQATRIDKVSPPLIKVLGAVRSRYSDLMLRAAGAPGATLGQRLYAARRSANLTISETALAAAVSDEDITAAESEEPVSAADAAAIEALIAQLG